jgi:hypothetical protein
MYAFSGLQAPVALSGCEDLFPILSGVLRDWSLEKRRAENAAEKRQH